jgi:hypothetical protein
MKVLYKSAGGKFTVEFEGDSQKDIFREIAQFQEIFETNNKHEPPAGCGGETLFNYRVTPGGDSYFEKRCVKCGMTYAYGQKKKGEVLFPNTKKGWHRWVPGQEEGNEESPPAAPFAEKNSGGAGGSKSNGKGGGRK